MILPSTSPGNTLGVFGAWLGLDTPQPQPYPRSPGSAPLWVVQTPLCQEGYVRQRLQGINPPVPSCGFMRHQLGVKKPAGLQGGNMETCQQARGWGKQPCVLLWTSPTLDHSEVTVAITEPSLWDSYGLHTLQTSRFSTHSFLQTKG